MINNQIFNSSKRSKSEHVSGRQIQQTNNPKIKIIYQDPPPQINNNFSSNQNKCNIKLSEKINVISPIQQKNVAPFSQQQQSARFQCNYVTQNKNLYNPIYEPATSQSKPNPNFAEINNLSDLKNRSISEYAQPQRNATFQQQKQLDSQSQGQTQPKILSKCQGYTITQKVIEYSGQKESLNNQPKNLFQFQQDQEQKTNEGTNLKQQNHASQKTYFQQKKVEQNNIFQSQVFDIQVICHMCNKKIDESQYNLNCCHNYHQDCLKSLIIQQLNEQNTILYCLCKMKIHRIPMIEKSFNDDNYKKLLENQIKFIFQNSKKQFQKCPQCKFFWVIDQYQQDNTKKQWCDC